MNYGSNMRKSLGRDFFIFRAGQFVSTIGDNCANIALAWWLLIKTGSAVKMGAVMAPVIFVRVVLLPLAGPIGDRFPRKWLVILGDMWRGAAFLIIAVAVHFDSLSLPILTFIFILSGIGTALFATVSQSIVSQLVKPDELQKAFQQSSAISSVGNIAGNAIGGIVVATIGPAGAFFFNSVSFFFAAIASFYIKADTRPVRRTLLALNGPFLATWRKELREGAAVILKIPLQLWICIVLSLLNCVSAPMNIALPILAKVMGRPATFLGMLNSSMGCGSIAGALAVGWMCKKYSPDKVIVGGIIAIGGSIAMLPVAVPPVMPIIAMFSVGAGMMLVNITLLSQLALATPNELRSRVDAITMFVGRILAPVGMFLGGIILSVCGTTTALLSIGLAMAVVGPLMFLIPRFSYFYRLSSEQAANYFSRAYPEVIDTRNS